MSGGVFPPDTEGMIKKGAHTGTEGPSALKVTARRSDFKPRTRRRVVPGEMAGFVRERGDKTVLFGGAH